MIFIFIRLIALILLFTQVRCKDAIKVGLLINGPTALAKDLEYKDDFFKQVNTSLTLKYTIDIVDKTVEQNGAGLRNVISDYSRDEIVNIFSIIKFTNYKEVNEILSEYNMTLWNIHPLPDTEIYSNIIFFGSVYKTLERCIIYIYILFFLFY